MNIPTGSSPHLENLIETYYATIFGVYDPTALHAIGLAIDQEVVRIGYSDRFRIESAHRAAAERLDSERRSG